MNAKQLIVECYAEQEGDCWVAVCLNFILAAQGDSFEEVKAKLEAMIKEYVYKDLDIDQFSSFGSNPPTTEPKLNTNITPQITAMPIMSFLINLIPRTRMVLVLSNFILAMPSRKIVNTNKGTRETPERFPQIQRFVPVFVSTNSSQ